MSYNENKKARRLAAIVYLTIMAIIMGGTYLSEQKKTADKIASSITQKP